MARALVGLVGYNTDRIGFYRAFAESLGAAAAAFRLFTGLAPDLRRMARTFEAACARRDAALAAAD